MTGGVDQVQHIGFAVVSRVFDPNGVRLNGDPALAFDIHAVQQLGFHITIRDGVCRLDQTVSKRRFTVVDVGHDRKIADMRKVGHTALPEMVVQRMSM